MLHHGSNKQHHVRDISLVSQIKDDCFVYQVSYFDRNLEELHKHVPYISFV